MSQASRICFRFLVFICGVIAIGKACDDPSKIATVEQKVGFSHIVIQGTVIRHYPLNQTPELFTAEIEVHCVFKDQGRRIPQFLNISRAGSDAGKCFRNELNIGEEYIIFLRNLSTRYETPEKEFSVKNVQDYKDLQTACGMSTISKYPEGITDKNSSKKCPDVKGYDCPPPKHIVAKEKIKRPPNNKGLIQGERTTNLIVTVTNTDMVGASVKMQSGYWLFIHTAVICRISV